MALSVLLRVMCLPFWVVILRVMKQEIERRKSVSVHPLVTPSVHPSPFREDAP